MKRVAVAVLLLASVSACGTGDTFFTSRVTGQLVDASTAEPMAGAWVVVLSRPAQAEDPEWLAYYADEKERRRSEVSERTRPERLLAEGVASDSIEWLGCEEGAGWTDAHGRFDLLLSFLRPNRPPPRSRMGALLIEVEGGKPRLFVLDERRGAWVENPASPGYGKAPWGTWELGRLEVR